MKYSVLLKIKTKAGERMLSLLKADISGDIKNSKITFNKDAAGVACKIAAADSVSLKASVNSIIKTIQVHENAEAALESAQKTS